MIFSGPFLSAWGPTGHRIIAEIAERHLTDEAKQAIKNILGTKPLARFSTWPDFLYSEKAWDFAKRWHFITVNDDEKLEDILKETGSNSEIENVVEAIKFFKKILQGEKDERDQFIALMQKNEAELKSHKMSVEAAALSFLVHFSGDVHQPMHVGLKEDMGGNKIEVLWFKSRSNLHSLWDGGLIESEGLSFSEYTRFIDHVSQEEILKLQSSNVEYWTNESIELRREIYKGIQYDLNEKTILPNLSYKYAHDYIEKVNERLLASGIRLAGLLNSIFK
jgi:hypothetical protein